MPVFVPIDRLVESGLFDFVGQGGLAGGQGVAWHYESAGESNAADLAGGVGK